MRGRARWRRSKAAAVRSSPVASVARLAGNRGAILFVVLVVVFTITTPHFLASSNISSVLIQAAITGTMAIGMAIAFIGGQFDLSVGSVLALGGFVAVHAAGGGTALAFLAAVAAGAACGLVNGFVVAVMRVNAFIATLGTMSVISGVTLLVSNQKSASTSAIGFLETGLWQVGPVPLFAIVCAALALAATWVMKRTPIGTTLRALGGNAEFCRLTGVPRVRYQIGIFMFTGLASGLSGAMTAAWVGGADPNAGQTAPLLVISACILGGVSLYGGVGTIAQALGGVMALAVLVDGMTLLNVSPYYQTLLEGAVLVLVVVIAAALHPEIMTRLWVSGVLARIRVAWKADAAVAQRPLLLRRRVQGGEKQGATD